MALVEVAAGNQVVVSDAVVRLDFLRRWWCVAWLAKKQCASSTRTATRRSIVAHVVQQWAGGWEEDERM